MEKNISEIRDEINKVDAELLKAFEKRMSLANEVAEYKIKNNMPVYDRKREREILNRVEREAGDELGSYAKVLYSTLFQISRSYQLKKIENKVSHLRGYHADTGEMNQEAFFAVSDYVTNSIPIFDLVKNMQKAADFMASKGIGMIHTVSGVGFTGDAAKALKAVCNCGYLCKRCR